MEITENGSRLEVFPDEDGFGFNLWVSQPEECLPASDMNIYPNEELAKQAALELENSILGH